jgi:HSP20 family protein
MAFGELMPWRRSGREPARSNEPFQSLRQQIDSLFDEFLRPSRTLAQRGAFAPEMDVTETEKEIRISAELPGLEKKDIQLNVTADTLTISGEKKEEREEKEEGRYYSERSYGRFERVVPLSTEVDAAQAKAEFKNGVLRLTLPKKPEAQPRRQKIEISS